jgi:hypothetical protein
MTISEWMLYLTGSWSLDEVDNFLKWHLIELNYDFEDVFNRWEYGV